MKHKNIFRGILLGQTCIEKKKRTWYHQLVRSCSGICVAFQIVPEQPEKPMFEQMMLKSLLYHDKDALQPRYYLIKVTSNYMFKATQEDGWREQYLTNGQWATQRTRRATRLCRCCNEQQQVAGHVRIWCKRFCAGVWCEGLALQFGKCK